AKAAVGREANLMARREDPVESHFPAVLTGLIDWIMVWRILVELNEGYGLEVFLSIEDNLPAAQTYNGRRPAPARMPDRAVGAAKMDRIIAGDRALLDEQLAHRDHFPFNLLAFGAQVVVFASRQIGIDFGNLQGAAVPPCRGEVRLVWLPVVLERCENPRG